MHELASVLDASSVRYWRMEFIRLISMYAALHILMCGDVYLFYFLVPVGIFPMGNSGRFPRGKPAATELRYPTLINYYPSECSTFV